MSLFLSNCRLPPPKPEEREPRFVRLVFENGRWWFVHRGQRFVSLGVNVVEPADGFQPADKRFYNVLPRYGNDREAWAQDALARLRQWGFTTVAAWSDPILYEKPVYHTRVVWMGPWGTGDRRLIDVFSPQYSNAIDRTAAKEIAPHATNEYLIGYFLNNELPWYGEKAWPTDSRVSLLTRYMLLPPEAPGKQRLLQFLRERYKDDFSAFSSNWNSKATDFEELEKTYELVPARREAQHDVVAWAGIVAEQYFRLVSEAMRRYDPNHLFLGVRFADRAYVPVFLACARYADVISINHYRKHGHFDVEHIGAIAELTGKPIMITEFSWRASENSSGCPNTIGADVTVPRQADRAANYRKFVTKALEQPYIVGLDWFMYHDQPPGGRFDGENSNYGLVDIYDNVYTTLVESIAEVNSQAQEIHASGPTSRPYGRVEMLQDVKEITLSGSDRTLPAPVLFADASSPYHTWGDFAHGAKINVEKIGTAYFMSVEPGSGWGVGVTFKAAEGCTKNPDGSSVNVSGAKQLLVEMEVPVGVQFSVGLQESGHGSLEAQVYDGFGGADGESYVHEPVSGRSGRQTYVFDLKNFTQSSSYGNQRGNSNIDLFALEQVHILFRGGQRPFKVSFYSIQFD